MPLIALACACDSPARVKPWRHAPDPSAEAENAPRSPALAGAAGSDEPDVAAAREHTIRIDVDAEPGRLSPLVAPSVWARRITLGTIFEPLLRYEPPDRAAGEVAGHYAPRLAHSWQIMPDGLEIRIELEPDATFQDGYPLTTSDVQFTLDAIRDPHNRIDHLRPLLDDVEAIELITSRQVRLRLRRPSAWALRALAEIPILPMHVYDGNLTGGGQLVGSGPWKFGSNKNGVVHLTRNDHYWGGPGAIADLEFVYQPDAAAAITAAKRGDLDVIPALIHAHYPGQATTPAIATAFTDLELAPPRMRAFAFNSARAPLDDANVRHALALLVDRKSIAKDVYNGLARPVQWPIWPGGFVSGSEPAIPEFDPTLAGKLLDAAGWIDSDKDGVRDRGGKPLHITIIGLEHPAAQPTANPKLHASARDAFADALRKAGVSVEVRTGGESWLAKHLADGAYDVVEVSWSGMADTDATALISTPVVRANAAAAGDDKPAPRATSPRVQRALEALAAAWAPADRARLSGELAAALEQTWPIAGIVADAPHGLVARRLTGVHVWDGWIDLSALRFAPAVPTTSSAAARSSE